MAQYELRLYMRNGCGAPLLGDVSMLDADDAGAATVEALRRVRDLPRHCFGALFDSAGVQVWEGDPPRVS